MSREVADPRVGFATITGIETTDDLRHAKVWVSVIGQPAEREAALAALRHAMPFIRHELGSRLRIRRIPDLHVHLDDTAERGTRILQMLAELETGRSRTRTSRSPSPCRRPSPGCRTNTTSRRSRRPRSSSRRRRGRGASATGPRPTTPRKGASRKHGDASTCGRISTRSRRRSSIGCAAPGACWRSATRTPTRTRSGATLGVVRIVEALGGTADAVCTDPVPAAVRVHLGRRALPDRPRYGRAVRPAWSSRTAARSSGSARSASATPTCSRGCPG